MHPVSGRGRWIWAVSGLATAAALAVPGARVLTLPGRDNQHAVPFAAISRVFPVSDAITSVDVQSQNGSVTVQSGTGHGVQVTEQISYDRSGGAPQPHVQDSISSGRLTLADPVCITGNCSVSFHVTVPARVSATVASGGAQVSVSGVAGATIDSGGGPVTLSDIGGPVTASTEGGSLQLTGLAGTLHADTAGGPLSAWSIDGPAVIATDGGSLDVNGLTGALQADSGGGPVSTRDLTAATATVTTGGGSARLVFAAPPESVNLFTDGGPAVLDVPAGPYALTTDSDGGPATVRILTSASATRTLIVSSGGGPLAVAPATATGR